MLSKSLNTLLLLMIAWPVQGIVIRHDVADSKYLAAAKRFPQTVGVGGMGNGTLVARDWVVTAAHVAEAMSRRKMVPFVMVGARRIEVSDIVVHPDWGGPETDLVADLALLKLREPVVDITPASLNAEYDEVDKQIWFVGNGWTGNGKDGPRKSSTRQYRAASNTVAQAPRTQLIFYFDPPDKGATDLEGISAPGDSGGPAFIERGGTVVLVGVSSAGDDAGSDGITGNYGDMEIYTRVAYFRDWLQSVMRDR